jgi:imidazole glycerol-phosphate synthase subunit HisF
VSRETFHALSITLIYMLSIRVIPSLLLKDTGLVKTIKFKNPTYIGDPINAVKIFNEKEVDEIVFLDISKTIENKQPNFDLIRDIANECFIPFAYGGGIKDIETIKNILKLGAEKVILNSAAFFDRSLITKASDFFGSQSIVVSIDVKKTWLGKKEVVVKCGSKHTGINPVDYAIEMQKAGAGELYVNSVDREGTRTGYDIDLLTEITGNVDIPVIASGGAGKLEDMKLVVEKAGVDAVAAGSLFVYYGNINGILINYPERKDIEELFQI